MGTKLILPRTVTRPIGAVACVRGDKIAFQYILACTAQMCAPAIVSRSKRRSSSATGRKAQAEGRGGRGLVVGFGWLSLLQLRPWWLLRSGRHG